MSQQSLEICPTKLSSSAGGLAPSLIVDQENLTEGAQAHIGTMDLDVGLTMAVLDDGLYRTLTERLRRAGFSMDENDEGGFIHAFLRELNL